MTQQRRHRSALARWAQLLVGLAAIWAVVFGLCPWLQRVPAVGRFHRHVRQEGIDATALFYTDSAEFPDAETDVRDSLRY